MSHEKMFRTIAERLSLRQAQAHSLEILVSTVCVEDTAEAAT